MAQPARAVAPSTLLRPAGSGRSPSPARGGGEGLKRLYLPALPPLIRRPSAATFSRKGRRKAFADYQAALALSLSWWARMPAAISSAASPASAQRVTLLILPFSRSL